MSSPVRKEACPACRAEGHDTKGDNLAIWPEGNGYCIRCGYKQYSKGETMSFKEAPAKLTVNDILTYKIGGDPARKIPLDILNEYQVRVQTGETTGKPDTVFYPYWVDPSSPKPAAYKCKRIRDKDFWCTRGKKGLFGKNTCKGGARFLMLTEGEEDALAAKVMFKGRPTKIDVVSIPDGAHETDKEPKSLYKEKLFFGGYDTVFICLDNDPEGKAFQSMIADWFSTFVKVRLVDLPNKYGKDAGDFYTGGYDKEFIAAVNSAKEYTPEGIVSGDDISLDDLLVADEPGVRIPFSGLNDKLGGLRKGEITTICAGSGIGKTTMVREIVKDLIEQGHSVANVALEDQMKLSAQALLALDMDIPLRKFRFNPPTKSECQPSYDKLIGNGKTYFFKHFGGLNSKKLMSTLYNYAKSKEVDYIVLDHISMVISSSHEVVNERKDIDSLMTKLAEMVVDTGVGLLQIVHLKRTSDGKSFAKGGEVELTDLRGSAALEQLSWSVVGLERDQQGDDSDFSRVRILKNRTYSYTGLCDHLKYHMDTGRMTNYEADEVSLPELDEFIEEIGE
jgi:twinkle protein